MQLKTDYVFDDPKSVNKEMVTLAMDGLIEDMLKIDSMNAPYMNSTNSKFVISDNLVKVFPKTPISYKNIPVVIEAFYTEFGIVKLYFDPDFGVPKITKTTYKRTGYDGATTCPYCKRNFCFSTNLRNTAHTYYAIGKSQPYTAYNKVCNFCGNEFSFYWDNAEHKYRYTKKGANIMPPKDYKEPTVKFCFDDSILKPHIDHVKFNGPATIVFWKDGTKTVVKRDYKERNDHKKAILYAFIRKIYGEGKAYHKIITEIEEAVK